MHKSKVQTVGFQDNVRAIGHFSFGNRELMVGTDKHNLVTRVFGKSDGTRHGTNEWFRLKPKEQLLEVDHGHACYFFIVTPYSDGHERRVRKEMNRARRIRSIPGRD